LPAIPGWDATYRLAAWRGRRHATDRPYSTFKALLLIAGTTAALMVLNPFLGVKHIAIVYLIPVVISATRWGTPAALVAVIGGLACRDFFFYPPLCTFVIDDPQQILDLILFAFVAVTTGYLATNLRRQTESAKQHEHDIRELYAFSRRLAQCEDAGDIYVAVEEHLSRTIQRRAVLIAATRSKVTGLVAPSGDRIRRWLSAHPAGRRSQGDRARRMIIAGAGDHCPFGPP